MDDLPLLIDVFPVSSHLINIKCAEYCKFSLLKLKSLYIPPLLQPYIMLCKYISSIYSTTSKRHDNSMFTCHLVVFEDFILPSFLTVYVDFSVYSQILGSTYHGIKILSFWWRKKKINPWNNFSLDCCLCTNYSLLKWSFINLFCQS